MTVFPTLTSAARRAREVAGTLGFCYDAFSEINHGRKEETEEMTNRTKTIIVRFPFGPYPRFSSVSSASSVVNSEIVRVERVKSNSSLRNELRIQVRFKRIRSPFRTIARILHPTERHLGQRKTEMIDRHHARLDFRCDRVRRFC